MIIKPPRLNPGDEIAIIAPAGPVTPEELKEPIERLITHGYRVKQANHLYRKQGYLAGNDDERLADLHEVFQNSNARAIFCARGGYGTLRLLERIDYGLIRRNPKILIGYSDITALLLAIFQKTGLIGFHGPVLREFSMVREEDLGPFLSPLSSFSNFELTLSQGTVLRKGRAKGTLLGGNLTLLSHLAGTSFMPSMKGAVLFIEEKGEPVYRVDRMLTHLRLCGVLSDLSGLIAGRFIDCGDISDINTLIKEITSGYDIPVFSGLPVGHGTGENIIIPLGLQADLDTENMKLSIPDSWVTD